MYSLVGRRVIGYAVALVALAGGVASAQQRAEAAVAEAKYSGGEIYFESLVSASSWALTVTGPNGFVLERRSQGSPPSVSLYDASGEPLVDGSYSYQLQPEVVVNPSALSKGQAAEGRGAGLRPGVVLKGLPALSGSFRVAGGAIVSPQMREPVQQAGGGGPIRAAAGDVPVSEPDYIAGNLEVNGAICVGADCTSGMTYPTHPDLVLQENNVSLRADDTSTGAFPANDWDLIFNDTASGGLDKFSIDDVTGAKTPFTIEAGARTNALYVDSSGNIGIGTNAPVLDVHVVTGDSPGLRLAQDGSSGFTPQTWDVAGNETNFFVRDVTGGSTLPLKIRPGAPTSSIDIAATGRVGIGDASPDATLQVTATAGTIGTGNAAAKLVNSAGPVAFQLDPSDNGIFWNFSAPSDSLFRISRSGTGATELELNSDGNLTLRGDLTITGGCTGCDGMFQPDYPLESLEEHAALMWENSFLPDVGPTPDGNTKIQVFQKTSGILKELEKAHIYIARLNEDIKEKDAEVADLRKRLERLETLLTGE